MKTKTILKTIGWLIAWLVSFQFISTGVHLMNQPSNLAFTAGIVLFLLTIVSIFGSAYSFTKTAAQLVTEYRESREGKQEEPEQELEEEVKQDKTEEL